MHKLKLKQGLHMPNKPLSGRLRLVFGASFIVNRLGAVTTRHEPQDEDRVVELGELVQALPCVSGGCAPA